MSIHSPPASTLVRDGFSSMGIAVDNLSMSEAVDRISGLIADYERDQRARFVATLNVDFIVNSLGYFFSRPSHPELLEILRSADLVTADGFPVVLLSKIMGKPIKERVTGADLVPALATRAVRDGLSMYLLGGKPGSAEQAAAHLVHDNLGLLIAGTDAPMVHVEGDALSNYERDDSAIVERINASGANILLIGFGNPKQEQWFYRNRSKLRVGVAIGVGGTFEFLAGSVKRAPAVFQRLNIEWLYRISQDPGRLWRR
jgi:N-acetylglucosaminyldiphosphoundecaprenol N-acetyl-beta-D-mannosaminyltransferase